MTYQFEPYEEMLFRLAKQTNCSIFFPPDSTPENKEKLRRLTKEHNCVYVDYLGALHLQRPLQAIITIMNVLGRNIKRQMIQIGDARIVFFTCTEDERNLLNLTAGDRFEYMYFQNLKDEFNL